MTYGFHEKRKSYYSTCWHNWLSLTSGLASNGSHLTFLSAISLPYRMILHSGFYISRCDHASWPRPRHTPFDGWSMWTHMAANILLSRHLYTLNSRLSSSLLCGKPLLLRLSNGRCYSQENVPGTEKMSFEKYRKLRRALKWRGRIAGIPLGLLAISTSSAINIHFNPDMFNPQPEVEIQPILWE